MPHPRRCLPINVWSRIFCPRRVPWTGHIPTELANLTALTYLSLDRNKLTGLSGCLTAPTKRIRPRIQSPLVAVFHRAHSNCVRATGHARNTWLEQQSAVWSVLAIRFWIPHAAADMHMCDSMPCRPFSNRNLPANCAQVFAFKFQSAIRFVLVKCSCPHRHLPLMAHRLVSQGACRRSSVNSRQ